MTDAQIAARKDIYRRLRRLSDADIAYAMGIIDTLEEHEPNEETIAALEETDRITRDPNIKKYATAKELFAELLEHEDEPALTADEEEGLRIANAELARGEGRSFKEAMKVVR